MIKRYISKIMDYEVDLQERMFRLISGIGIIALILMVVVSLISGENIENLIVLFVCLVYVITVVSNSLAKKRIERGAVLIALFLLILCPVNFFTAGGMEGGTPLWFGFFFVYISLTLHGTGRRILYVISIIATFACYYIAYFNPEFVIQHTKPVAYLDSAITTVVVGSLTSFMIWFQNHIYREENRITQKQKQEIEELNEAENHFFSSMSHEIRTPINTIIGLNEMNLRSAVTEEVVENSRNIQGASKMLLTLINDILDMSRLESGRMEIINVSYETGVFFSDIINMIWIKAQEKGLEFHLDIDASMPSQLYGDEVRIKQVLINLLNNAVKYTRQGSITLSVRCERKSLNRVCVYYSVEDTGEGIKQEDIPTLFSVFKRVEEEKNRHIEGTGLGLSIVKQLVNLMGGEVTVNSVYTKGSTFLVTLEQGIVDERALGTFTLDSRVRMENHKQYKQSFEAPKAHLLIVDDNEMNLVVAKKLLRDTRIQIDTASGGEECLKLTLNRHYDGILMDHLMPGMDGIECLHAIRAQTAGMCRDVPVIALTANAGSENQLLYKNEGFKGYLPKPVNGALLEAAVMNILPQELVILGEEPVQADIGKDVIVFDEKTRDLLMITTDSVSDLPAELMEQMGICVCPSYILTEKGRFVCGRELDTDGLLNHMEQGGECVSQAPQVEDYVNFFAEKLTEAQNIIHIAMAKDTGEEYGYAKEAAKSFENVTVLDSGCLTSGQGLLALFAANMALHNAPLEEIVEQVQEFRNRISCSFIVSNTGRLYLAGRISKKIHTLSETMMMHPLITLRKSKMTVSKLFTGSFAHVTGRYIRSTFKHPENIDKRILFITYVGMDRQSLENIQKTIQKYCSFERVYLLQASSSIASNCGAGTLALTFIRKAKG